MRTILASIVLLTLTSFAHAQSCESNDDCGTDLWCVGGQCISRCIVPMPKKLISCLENGSACNPSASECCSGVCTPNPNQDNGGIAGVCQ